ncbi:DUF2249 domain-containing protein [Rhodopseudomonas telluris]|uniref:DUF2249 domain-containing protein n=1 Tax=Rhodopseudomonas telluris TaxID=644215 RepID=A0ABV6EU64_9BRAD
MTEAATTGERILDVRQIPHQQRHEIIPRLFDNLQPGQGMQIVVDHDPRPLKYFFEAVHGDDCQWTYLEEGPELWRVQLRRAA